jgi:HPt (histidine-containing phosphotransfer) domain-containing protein
MSDPLTEITHAVSAYASDPDFAELLVLFADRLPGISRELAAAVATLDYTQVAILAHRLKGVAGGYGFSELGAAAAQLEQAAVAEDASEVGAAWTLVRTQLRRAAAGMGVRSD